MQNRQKDEIIRDILSCTNGGATISQILFRAYTSHAQAKLYLGILVDKGYIEYHASERKYRTTSEGLQYLAVASQITSMLNVETRRFSKDDYGFSSHTEAVPSI